MEIINNKDKKLTMMINDDGYYISKDLYPVVIFSVVKENENSKLLDGEIQKSCKWNDYMDGIDMVSSYLYEQDENLEKIGFIEPKNQIFIRELKDRGYVVEDGLIMMGKKRCR